MVFTQYKKITQLVRAIKEKRDTFDLELEEANVKKGKLAMRKVSAVSKQEGNEEEEGDEEDASKKMEEDATKLLRDRKKVNHIFLLAIRVMEAN